MSRELLAFLLSELEAADRAGCCQLAIRIWKPPATPSSFRLELAIQ